MHATFCRNYSLWTVEDNSVVLNISSFTSLSNSYTFTITHHIQILELDVLLKNISISYSVYHSQHHKVD